MKAPIQCVFWRKPELIEGMMKDNFELLKTFVYEDHFWRYLLKCRECGQLYFFEFYEEIDWQHSQDAQHSKWIPVDTIEDGQRVYKLSRAALEGMSPRLQKDLPMGIETTTLAWVRDEA